MARTRPTRARSIVRSSVSPFRADDARGVERMQRRGSPSPDPIDGLSSRKLEAHRAEGKQRLMRSAAYDRAGAEVESGRKRSRLGGPIRQRAVTADIEQGPGGGSLHTSRGSRLRSETEGPAVAPRDSSLPTRLASTTRAESPSAAETTSQTAKHTNTFRRGNAAPYQSSPPLPTAGPSTGPTRRSLHSSSIPSPPGELRGWSTAAPQSLASGDRERRRSPVHRSSRPSGWGMAPLPLPSAAPLWANADDREREGVRAEWGRSPTPPVISPVVLHAIVRTVPDAPTEANDHGPGLEERGELDIAQPSTHVERNLRTLSPETPATVSPGPAPPVLLSSTGPPSIPLIDPATPGSASSGISPPRAESRELTPLQEDEAEVSAAAAGDGEVSAGASGREKGDAGPALSAMLDGEARLGVETLSKRPNDALHDFQMIPAQAASASHQSKVAPADNQGARQGSGPSTPLQLTQEQSHVSGTSPGPPNLDARPPAKGPQAGPSRIKQPAKHSSKQAAAVTAAPIEAAQPPTRARRAGAGSLAVLGSKGREIENMVWSCFERAYTSSKLAGPSMPVVLTYKPWISSPGERARAVPNWWHQPARSLDPVWQELRRKQAAEAKSRRARAYERGLHATGSVDPAAFVPGRERTTGWRKATEADDVPEAAEGKRGTRGKGKEEKVWDFSPEYYNKLAAQMAKKEAAWKNLDKQKLETRRYQLKGEIELLRSITDDAWQKHVVRIANSPVEADQTDQAKWLETGREMLADEGSEGIRKRVIEAGTKLLEWLDKALTPHEGSAARRKPRRPRASSKELTVSRASSPLTAREDTEEPSERPTLSTKGKARRLSTPAEEAAWSHRKSIPRTEARPAKRQRNGPDLTPGTMLSGIISVQEDNSRLARSPSVADGKSLTASITTGAASYTLAGETRDVSGPQPSKSQDSKTGQALAALVQAGHQSRDDGEAMQGEADPSSGLHYGPPTPQLTDGSLDGPYPKGERDGNLIESAARREISQRSRRFPRTEDLGFSMTRYVPGVVKGKENFDLQADAWVPEIQARGYEILWEKDRIIGTRKILPGIATQAVQPATASSEVVLDAQASVVGPPVASAAPIDVVPDSQNSTRSDASSTENRVEGLLAADRAESEPVEGGNA